MHSIFIGPTQSLHVSEQHTPALRIEEWYVFWHYKQLLKNISVHSLQLGSQHLLLTESYKSPLQDVQLFSRKPSHLKHFSLQQILGVIATSSKW